MAIIRPVTRQHTVSRVVLRRFTFRHVMTIYDAKRQIFLDKGPRAGFYMPFDTYDPYGSEALWAY